MIRRLSYGTVALLMSVALAACGGGGTPASAPVQPSQRQLPPEITRLAILPDAPTTLDTLVADFAATDVNGDTLSYTLTWSRNGTPLSYASATMLPPGQHFKGDDIELTLEVSDAHASTVAQVSRTIVNSAPSNVTPQLVPAAPTGLTDVSMRYSTVGVDADGDLLSPSYAWRRNGAAIVGQTGALLPHTQFVPGDVISAVLTLSDGEASGTGEVSVTIQDAPPVVDVGSAPGFVPVGETMSFVATATDGDGGPRGNFVVAYGPAGMTVDPDTGIVSWLPNGPLFVTNTQVHWGITVDRPGAAVAAGTTTVVDPVREYPMLRQGLRTPLPRQLQIGDFDGDGDQEALIASDRGLYELAYEGGRYHQIWAYPFAIEGSDYPVFEAFTAGDVDGDGRAEIFAGNLNTIVKLDGKRRLQVASVALLSNTSNVLRELKLADLNGDGAPELIALSSFNRLGMPWVNSTLTVLDPVTLTVLHDFGPDIYGGSLAVANVDNDAALEIITGGGYVIDGATWQTEWHYAPGFGSEVSAGDTNADGIAEIVASVDFATVQAYSAVTQSLLWNIPNTNTETVLVADVTGDAVPEIIVGDGPGGGHEIKVYRQDPGLGTTSLLFRVDAQGNDVPSLTAGDLDGDGEIELLWGSAEASLAVGGFHPGLEIEWSSAQDSPQQISGHFVGGVLAVSALGKRAVVFATGATGLSGMRPFTMDPATGDFVFGREFPTPFNGVLALTAADYDRDGTDELLWACTDLNGASHIAYDFFADAVEWSSSLISEDSSGAAIAHADLNGDGDEDIVSITYDGRVRAFDPMHDTAIWTSPQFGNGRAVAAVDLNHSGAPEIILAAEYHIAVYSRDNAGTFLEIARTPEIIGLADMVVADVNGDGAAEIFALRNEGANAVDRFDAKLQPLGSFDTGVAMNGIALEETGFARKNLLLYSQSRGSFIAAVDPTSGAEIWRSPGLFGEIEPGGVHLVDAAGDGLLRMAIATNYGVMLTR